MALNLLTYIEEQFSPTVVDQLSSHLNESPVTIQKAVKAVIPTVLGGLARRVQQDGAGGIIDLLEDGNYGSQSTPLDIAQVADSRIGTQTAVGAGSNFISGIFGNDIDAIAGQIAAYSGIQSGSALALMDLVGSSLMGILGRQRQEAGLSAFNLSSLMAGQIGLVKGALPDQLASVRNLLAFDQLDTTDKTNDAIQGIDTFDNNPVNPNIPKSPEGERRRENNRWLRWALILVAILVVALAVQKCREPQDSTSGVYTDTTSRVESDAVEDTSAATRQNIRDQNGQVRDSSASGPLGIRDSTDQR